MAPHRYDTCRCVMMGCGRVVGFCVLFQTNSSKPSRSLSLCTYSLFGRQKMIRPGSRVHLRTRDAIYDTGIVTDYKKRRSISVRFMKSRTWDPQLRKIVEDWRTDDVAWKRIERLVEIL